MNSILWDLIRRSFYLCFFIIPIPLGAYTVHSGDSAFIALVWYLILSFFIPFFYLSSPRSGFGVREKRVPRTAFVTMWGLIQGLTYYVGVHFSLDFIWALTTIGRDLVFAVVMYSQIVIMLFFSYIVTSLGKVDAQGYE